MWDSLEELGLNRERWATFVTCEWGEPRRHHFSRLEGRGVALTDIAFERVGMRRIVIASLIQSDTVGKEE
jgi:hypothetical protein